MYITCLVQSGKVIVLHVRAVIFKTTKWNDLIWSFDDNAFDNNAYSLRIEKGCLRILCNNNLEYSRNNCGKVKGYIFLLVDSVFLRYVQDWKYLEALQFLIAESVLPQVLQKLDVSIVCQAERCSMLEVRYIIIIIYEVPTLCFLTTAGCKLENRPFYSSVSSCLAFEWIWGWSWPCFDTNFPAFFMLMMLFSF